MNLNSPGKNYLKKLFNIVELALEKPNAELIKRDLSDKKRDSKFTAKAMSPGKYMSAFN